MENLNYIIVVVFLVSFTVIQVYKKIVVMAKYTLKIVVNKTIGGIMKKSISDLNRERNGLYNRRTELKELIEITKDFISIRQVFLINYAKEDRKSTRLNSSHQIIPYAVFCLKKKKSTEKYNINRKN